MYLTPVITMETLPRVHQTWGSAEEGLLSPLQPRGFRQLMSETLRTKQGALAGW